MIGWLFLVCSAEAGTFLHYSFDGTGATSDGHVFADDSGNGNDGTMVDLGTVDNTTYTISPAAFGDAWSHAHQLDNDRIDLQTPFAPGVAAPWSIGFWHDVIGINSMPLFDFTASDTHLQLDVPGATISLSINGQTPIIWDTPALTGASFNHLVLVADPAGISGVDQDADLNDDNVALYVDGVLQGTTSIDLHLYATDVFMDNYGDGSSVSNFQNSGHGVTDELWVVEDAALSSTAVGLLMLTNRVCEAADTDGDSLPDDCDTCPSVDASSCDFDGDGCLDDADADTVDDCSDICPGVDDLLDTDADGLVDCLDACPLDNAAACDLDADGCLDDADADTVGDCTDICPGGDDTLDGDGDRVPDFCDQCVGHDAFPDADGDGICEDIDGCLGDDATGDTDVDGVCDDLDPCPADFFNDSDGDGVCDGVDLCSGDDAFGDTDSDGVCDDIDPCPLDATDDSDLDGVCDGVDVCSGDDATGDSDADGVCDDIDLCSGDDVSGDTDSDGVCDDTDICPDDPLDDSDGDGICDGIDICDGFDDAIDTDADAVPDGCDPCPEDATDDTDGDGSCDSVDLCTGDDDTGDDDADGFCADVDCGDGNPTVFPDAPELCDGLDNACAGLVPDEEADEDGDGLSICEGDCDDGDPERNSDMKEICEDGIDNDCDDIDQDCLIFGDTGGDLETGCGCSAVGSASGGWWLLGLVALARRRNGVRYEGTAT